MKTTPLITRPSASFMGKQSQCRSSLIRRIAAACLAVALLLLIPAAQAEIFWSVLAGKDTGIGTADGPGGFGLAPRFDQPTGIALDASGNLYVTDSGNSMVRKITPANSQIGEVVTLAGQAGIYGEVDGTGLRAQFSDPEGVAVAPNGDIYVADGDGCIIRKVTPAGVVTTWAGRAYQRGSADGDRLSARFNIPLRLAFDAAGNLYVADSGNHTIRRISPGGSVTTIAGAAGQAGSTDGNGVAARFQFPCGLAFDRAQNLHIADLQNGTIRRMTPGGNITTIAGTPQVIGYVDGSRTQARFSYPTDVAVDSQGFVYVAEATNTTLRVIAPDGTVSSLPASIWNQETPGYPQQFSSPAGMVITADGTLYVADRGNHAIRRVKAGLATTYAGYPGVARASQDGIGNAARFKLPQAAATDAAGNVYVVDANLIRKITPQGVVTTLAGGYYGEDDGLGSAASFYYPSSMAVDPAGNIFVSDLLSGSIRKVTPSGMVTTILRRNPNAQNGTQGIAIDLAGNFYLCDTDRNVIIKVTPAGVMTTLAGLSGVAGSADGTGSAALFNQPTGIAVNGAGTIFVSDTNNHTIRKITPAGVVTTLAGWVGRLGNANGIGAAAQFYQPRGLKLAPDGSLVVADSFNHQVRRVTMSGAVITLGGFPGSGASRSGFYRDARFSKPVDVAVSPTGLIYVAEADSTVISVGRDGPGLALTADGDSLPVPGGLVDFGNVLALGGSDVVRIGVQNTGNTIFQNLAVQIVGPNASDFTAGPPFDSYIAYGSTAFNLVFTPRATGPRTARVRITSTGGGINAVEFNVTGTGVTTAIDFVTISSNNANPAVAAQGDVFKVRYHISGPFSYTSVSFPRIYPLPPASAPASALGGGYYEFTFGPYLLPPGRPVAFSIYAIGSDGGTAATATQTTDGTSVTVAPYQTPF